MPATFQTRTRVQDRPDASPRFGAVRTGSFRRILVPVDFSTATRAALESALACVGHSDGVISLLHVVAPPVFMGGTEAVVLMRPEIAIAGEAEANLERLAAQLRTREVLAEVLVRQGKVAAEICRMAEEMDAELIVMGRHDHAWWERLVATPTSEKVLHQTPCAVMVLPGTGTADDALYAPEDGAPEVDGEPAPSRDRSCHDEAPGSTGAFSHSSARDPRAFPQQRQG